MFKTLLEATTKDSQHYISNLGAYQFENRTDDSRFRLYTGNDHPVNPTVYIRDIESGDSFLGPLSTGAGWMASRILWAF